MKEPDELMKLAAVDIRAAGTDELADVSGVCFDPRIPQALRAGNVLNAAGNPYCFRVGKLGVKLEFMDGAPPLQDVFLRFLQRKGGRE